MRAPRQAPRARGARGGWDTELGSRKGPGHMGRWVGNKGGVCVLF